MRFPPYHIIWLPEQDRVSLNLPVVTDADSEHYSKIMNSNFVLL